MFGLLASGFAGRDDADEFVFDFDMYDDEQSPLRIPANCSILRLFVARCVDHPEKRIEENFGGMFKQNAVLILIARCLGLVPHKCQAVEFEADIHDGDNTPLYCICQYK